MNLKTCLLVTDDPDDHQSFTEALSEISPNTVTVVILDSAKASMLLQEKKFIPDYIFVDLSMHDIHIKDFMGIIKHDRELRDIPVMLYGDEGELEGVENIGRRDFFSKDYNYAELRSILIRVLQEKEG